MVGGQTAVEALSILYAAVRGTVARDDGGLTLTGVSGRAVECQSRVILGLQRVQPPSSSWRSTLDSQEERAHPRARHLPASATVTEPNTDVNQGTLDLLILKTLSLQPMHGFGIARRIEQISRGVFRINPGSLL